MIKHLFFDDDFNIIHTQYICLDHDGFASEQAQRYIMALFKDGKDYFKLGKAGRTTDNMYKLLTEYPAFFKRPVEVTLKRKDKFMELVKLTF